jgi:DnaK suppressor protein
LIGADVFADEGDRDLFSGDCTDSRSTPAQSSSSILAEREPDMTAAARSGAAALPVRTGEKPWTETELVKVRKELEAEVAGLRADISRAESQIAERLSDAVGDAGDDQADAGAKTFEREHELAMTQNARDLLAQNEQALARIDAGTYGVCESCGQPIGKARLQAFPRATLCVSCKQREERR